MPGRTIFRAEALRRRALRIERPAPPPPVPSARAVRLLWVLLVLTIAGLAALGRTVSRALDAAQGDAHAQAAAQ